MCDPVTIATMALGAGQSIAQISSVNSSLEAQAASVNAQAERAYSEQAYETQQAAKAAVEEGYITTIQKRQAEGSAKVRNAALGIRGTTANENVSEETRVGNFNIGGANESLRNASTAYTLGSTGTQSYAGDSIASLRAQAPSPFEMLVNTSAGTLGGYMTGNSINAARNRPRVG